MPIILYYIFHRFDFDGTVVAYISYDIIIFLAPDKRLETNRTGEQNLNCCFFNNTVLVHSSTDQGEFVSPPHT